MSAQEAWQRSTAGELVLIDIRSVGEWRETGIPEGARRVSMFSSYGFPNVDFLDEIADVTGGETTQPVALICAGGVRSSLARSMLEAEGFAEVYDVAEGMLGSSDGPGWLARGLPIEDCGACAPP